METDVFCVKKVQIKGKTLYIASIGSLAFSLQHLHASF